MVDKITETPLVRYGGLYAVLTACALFVASFYLPVEFGTIVMGITMLTGLAWVLIAGGSSTERTRAASPLNELFFGTATRYGSEGPQSSETVAPTGVKMLLLLTGLSIFGWVITITAYVL